MLDKAEYSAFESTLNSSIVSYRIVCVCLYDCFSVYVIYFVTTGSIRDGTGDVEGQIVVDERLLLHAGKSSSLPTECSHAESTMSSTASLQASKSSSAADVGLNASWNSSVTSSDFVEDDGTSVLTFSQGSACLLLLAFYGAIRPNLPKVHRC